MATWKDGAAYAPIERPDGFATPVADPLSQAEPRPQLTPGSVPPPARLDVPESPVPLDRPATSSVRRRDPGQPFDVAHATMTSIPLTADGKRDPRAPFAIAATDVQAPAAQPPPPAPDQRPLSAAPTPSGLEPGQKPLVLLIAGLCTVGVVLTNAAPILLLVAGLLAVLRLPWLGKIGAISLGVGSIFVLVQLLLPSARPGVLFGLSSLLLGAAFLIRAFAVKSNDEAL